MKSGNDYGFQNGFGVILSYIIPLTYKLGQNFILSIVWLKECLLSSCLNIQWVFLVILYQAASCIKGHSQLTHAH